MSFPPQGSKANLATLETRLSEARADGLDRRENFLDFFSSIADSVTITSSAADLDFPDIVVAGIPSGATISRVVLILLARAVEDTSGSENYINGASKAIRIKKSSGAWGTDDVAGITFDDESLKTLAGTKEGGPTIISATDIKAEVDGNATYNVRSEQTNRSDAIVALGNNLVLYDVQVGLRVFYN